MGPHPRETPPAAASALNETIPGSRARARAPGLMLSRAVRRSNRRQVATARPHPAKGSFDVRMPGLTTHLARVRVRPLLAENDRRVAGWRSQISARGDVAMTRVVDRASKG